MARNYATTPTAIWRPGSTFASLSIDAQWAHWMLTSQPDISAAGTLSINLRRWTHRARDAERDRLVRALKELGDGSFIVYDQDTEELWIRVFVEWDGGYNNRKRQPVIRSAALEVESPSIRQALAAELQRLGFPVDGLADRPSDSLSRSTDSPSDAPSRDPSDQRASSADAAVAPPSDGREYSQGNRLSRSPSDTESRSDRVVVTGVEPLTTHNPQPTTPPPPSGGAGGNSKRKSSRGERGTRLPEDWAPSESTLEWYRNREFGDVKLSAIVDLDVQIEMFRNHWLTNTGANSTKRDWNRAFQNWLLEAGQRAQRYASNGARPTAGPNTPHPHPLDQQCQKHRGLPGGNRDDGTPRCGQCRIETTTRSAP